MKESILIWPWGFAPAVDARIPAMTIDDKLSEPVQKLSESVTAKPYEDMFTRKERGRKHQDTLPEMVDTFLKERSSCVLASRRITVVVD